MRKMIVLALAASLAACASMPAATPSALDRAQAAFDRIELAAQVLRPMMPVDAQARVTVLLARIKAGLALARAASDLATRDAAIVSIAGDIAALGAATSPP